MKDNGVSSDEKHIKIQWKCIEKMKYATEKGKSGTGLTGEETMAFPVKQTSKPFQLHEYRTKSFPIKSLKP